MLALVLARVQGANWQRFKRLGSTGGSDSAPQDDRFEVAIRFVLSPPARCCACSAVAGVAPALAEDPIAEVLQNGSAEWQDGFDAASVGAADVRTTIPTLSPQIVNALQTAITQYSDIVSRGGWPVVPAEKKLKIGMRDPAVVVLRQRLAISGDLAGGSRCRGIRRI